MNTKGKYLPPHNKQEAKLPRSELKPWIMLMEGWYSG